MEKDNIYHIYVNDENDKPVVMIKEKGEPKEFDCEYAAEQYAKSVGLVRGFEIR